MLNPLDAAFKNDVEHGLSEDVKKFEHRVDVLTSISRERRVSGYYELAEAYRKQAAESKVSAQSIRRLLNLGQGEVVSDGLNGIKHPFQTSYPTGKKSTESVCGGLRE